MQWKWPLVRRTIDLGAETMTIHLVADVEAVLDRAIAEEKAGRPATMPYWASLWPSGVELATWARVHVLPNQRVLDLGCGTGVVGCAALLAGGIVTFADNEPDAVDLALLNADALGGSFDGRVFDLTTDRFEERFDVILCGDLLYERPLALEVRRFLSEQLADGGVAVLADPYRSAAEVFLSDDCVVHDRGKVRLIERSAQPRGT